MWYWVYGWNSVYTRVARAFGSSIFAGFICQMLAGIFPSSMVCQCVILSIVTFHKSVIDQDDPLRALSRTSPQLRVCRISVCFSVCVWVCVYRHKFIYMWILCNKHIQIKIIIYTQLHEHIHDKVYLRDDYIWNRFASSQKLFFKFELNLLLFSLDDGAIIAKSTAKNKLSNSIRKFCHSFYINFLLL